MRDVNGVMQLLSHTEVYGVMSELVGDAYSITQLVRVAVQ